MNVRYTPTHISPKSLELLAQIAPMAAVNTIRQHMAKGEPIYIQPNGQRAKEMALCDFINCLGGLALIINDPVQYEAPPLGRGGER